MEPCVLPNSLAAGRLEDLMSAVLVVEDEQSLRELLQLALTEAGHVVQLAENGKQAMDFLNTLPEIDVLVCDLGVPDVAARTVVEAAQRRHPRLRVLIVSGASQDVLRTVQIPQPYTFIPKPFRIYDVVNCVGGYEHAPSESTPSFTDNHLNYFNKRGDSM